MQISKVKLQKGGFRGIEVSYVQQVDTKNVGTSTDEISRKVNTPVTQQMLSKFGVLKNHFATIMDEPENLVEVNGVSVAAAGGFVIIGSKKVLGNKSTSYNTPLVVESDLDSSLFEEVTKTIDEIFELTQAFIEARSVDHKQLVIAFNEKSAETDRIDVSQLTDPEILKYAKELLEKAGCMVMGMDELAGAFEQVPGTQAGVTDFMEQPVMPGEGETKVIEHPSMKEKVAKDAKKAASDIVIPVAQEA